MAYALAKLQNQNRSDILMQGNEQLGDLDFEENNLMTDYNSQLAALKEDKESRLTELSIDFQNKINAINDELVNANVSRREALTNLRTDVANEALANIAQLDAEISSFTEEMTNRANARLGEINAARLSATASDFAPTTQLGQVNSGLRMGPSASALGELSFFRPTSRDEE
jgi:phage host-nuclease inhibitor protein Gam